MNKILQNIDEAVAAGQAKAKEASKVQAVVMFRDIQIIAEPPSYLNRYNRTLEDRAKAYESWAQELQDFVRDHRSQDPVQLSVERITARVCSGCERDWETMEEDGVTCCAWCGEEVAKGA